MQLSQRLSCEVSKRRNAVWSEPLDHLASLKTGNYWKILVQRLFWGHLDAGRRHWQHLAREDWKWRKTRGNRGLNSKTPGWKHKKHNSCLWVHSPYGVGSRNTDVFPISLGMARSYDDSAIGMQLRRWEVISHPSPLLSVPITVSLSSETPADKPASISQRSPVAHNTTCNPQLPSRRT